MARGMKLWPIVAGLSLWGGAGYLASRGTWWPLWVVAAVSFVPGLFALIAVVFMRTVGKTVGQGVAQVIDKGAETQPKRARTNLRNAARRNIAALGFTLGVTAPGQGCQRIIDARDERIAAERGSNHANAPVSTVAPASTAPAEPKPSASVATGEDPELAAVLERAIVPPVSDGTYIVDPFVAALVYERLRAGKGPTFTRVDAVPAGPTGGYRVTGIAPGSLWARLGLKDGDVIEGVNRVLLTGPDRIGFALDGAQNRVDVSVFRDDLTIVNRYRLDQAVAWPALLAAIDPGSAVVAVDVARGGDGASQLADAPPSAAAPDGSVPTHRPTGSTSPRSEPSGSGMPARENPRPSTPPSGGTTPRPSGGTPPSTSSAVVCESAGRCTIEKAYFDKLVASGSIESQANIVPAIQDDVFSGYKLKSIKPGSAIAKLGFHSGDKITHINGQDLTDEMGAVGLYLGLGNTKVFKIRYERGGTKQVKIVVVQ